MATDRGLEPSFVVPDGWLLDPLVRSRLVTQLDRAPSTVSAIVAPTGPIPPGSSYRVHAERAVLRTTTHLAGTDEVVRGAALVRAGVPYERSEAGVVVRSGEMLVDRGTHVHDPWADVAPLEAASELGRSPFPRRPIVLFLKCETDDELDLADWSRALVNGLVRHDVEARLGRVAASPGLQLTRPCLPVEQSVRALRPDVIVALDDLAADNATRWCEGDRRTIVVEYDLDPSLTVDLVSWRIGRSRDRVRARIGQAVDAAGLARLVNRLCSGPQPRPPAKDAVDINVTPLPVPARAATAPATRRLSVVRPDSEASDRLGGLAEYAARTGWIATETRPDEADDDAMEADVVVLDGALPDDAILALAERRMAMGRRAVVDVAGRSRSTEAAKIIERCGYALVGHASEWDPSWSTVAKVQILPALLRPSELLGLAEARTEDEARGDVPAVGLVVEPGADPTVACDAIASLQELHPDLELRMWGDLTSVPAERSADVDDGRPAASERAALSVVLLVQRARLDVADGLPRDLVELALLGVPVVFEQRASSMWDGALSRFAVPASADSESWSAAAASAVRDPHIATFRARLVTRADTLFGLKASQSIVSRILGWATFEGRQP